MSIAIVNDELQVTFGAPWSLDGHALFLKSKSIPEAHVDYDPDADAYTLRAPSRFASLLGVEQPKVKREGLPLASHLFDYQAWIVERAIEAKRFAVWADCGLGKTCMFLEWARHVTHLTNGRVLILSPLNIIEQTVEESAKFYAGVRPDVLTSRETLIEWSRSGASSLAICNYEKFIPGVIDELRWLSGLVLDESSILKSGGGVIKWNLIKSARGIPYKLSCTATPAPNDTMEYASQASFLEKLRAEGEILWTFFHRDPKTQQWKVKPHARQAFYQFMSSWSIYLRSPAAYGFKNNFAVPEPEIIEHRLEPLPNQLAEMRHFAGTKEGELLPPSRLGVTARTKLSQIAKGFIYEGNGARSIVSKKPLMVGQIAQREMADRQVLIWTVFDEEARILGQQIPQSVVLDGSVKEADRGEILERFRHGKIRVLISKAQLLGMGMNFQFCEAMIFSGFNDSFEAFYQAVRRAHRYGATRRLRVHVPYVAGLEDHMWENILRKKSQWEDDIAQQEKNYVEASKS